MIYADVNRVNNSFISTMANPIDWSDSPNGILAERMKVDFSVAFAELRSIARSSQRPIHQVAAQIVHDLGRTPANQYARAM